MSANPYHSQSGYGLRNNAAAQISGIWFHFVFIFSILFFHISLYAFSIYTLTSLYTVLTLFSWKLQSPCEGLASWLIYFFNSSIYFPTYYSGVKPILNSSSSRKQHGVMDSPFVMPFCKLRYGLSTNCDHSSILFTNCKSLNSVPCSNIFLCFESMVLWQSYCLTLLLMEFSNTEEIKMDNEDAG